MPSVLVAVVFALAALISVSVAWGAMTAIEAVSKSAIDRGLLLEGEDWAQVETNGLQVVLSGTAPNESARFHALSIAGGEVDAGRVIDRMEVPPPAAIVPPAFSIEMLRNEAGISMIGLIPAATDREDLGQRIQRIDLEHAVTDLLETADYPVPELWDMALNYALDAVAMLPRSKISIRPDRVAIEAIADSADQKANWERTLRQRVPGGVRLTLDISAPRPVITPFTLRFTIDENGARFDACTAHTEAGRTKIVAAGIAAGVRGRPNCTIGLGVPSPDWPDAVSRGIGALREMGGGSLTFADADVTLVAAEGTPQDTYDRVIGELEADLPDVFSLHAVLPEPVSISGTGEASGPPEFVATLSPEGQVQLRGRVADEQERTIVESFARARFGIDKVYSAMRLDPDLPRGWSVRTLAALEALDQLANGAVVVQPLVVDVRGVTGDQEASAEISRLLSEKLGEAEDFRVNVSYEEKYDPQAALPTPQECVAGINTAMTDQKITFAPGSAEIELASGRTVDRIAEILKTCPDVAMEIGGYTDSQGREEMNQALSQRRAEAVLSALLARRVLTTNLSAHGYGEENPIADNGTEEGREANRRIEFRLIGAEGEPVAAEGEPAAEDGTGDTPEQDGAAELPDIRPEARPDDAAESTGEDAAEAVEEDTPAEDDATATAEDTATGDEAATEAAGADTGETADTGTADTAQAEAEAEPADEPVVVDPELAGIRPKPRPAQDGEAATE
ncbi:OmpA family protein [Sinisalibacter aestuarii]|nr:OmpA family protein [Sinisalibacter aestuarii]